MAIPSTVLRPQLRQFARESVQPMGSLSAIRAEARRERMIDMELRLRPYRIACFAILAVALVSVGGEVGWWWTLPLLAALGVFALVDSLALGSGRPGFWIGAAWGVLPMMIAGAVSLTGGAGSPALMWFALPAVTLGARFEPRGMAFGTAYVLALLCAVTYGLDPVSATAHHREFVAAIALVLCTVILSGALVESDRAHRRQSTLDPLTGLFNRSALDQRLAEIDGEATSAEEGVGYAMLLCDLDHFKRVNDRLGHVAGDAVLQDVAYTMRAALRAGDSIFRVGGEEILVMLPGAGIGEANEIAERLRAAVRERRPVGVDVTVSIGVAATGPGPIDTGDLVARADDALYAAKAGGRDLVFVDSGAPAALSG